MGHGGGGGQGSLAPLTCGKLQLRLMAEGALGEQEPALGIPAGVCQGPVNWGDGGNQHPHQRPWG